MWELDQVGVVKIESGTHLLVWGKTMAENNAGLVLLQHWSFFDDHISVTRNAVFVNQLFVLRFLWATLSSISLKLTKHTLE